MVKTPQGLSARACTTTSARTASKIIMIARTLTKASRPTPRPISSLPFAQAFFRRAGSRQTEQSCRGRRRRASRRSRSRECREENRTAPQDGTNQRPRAGNGCKVVPENHPAVCWHIILVVVLQHGRRGALLVEHKHFCRQPFAVKTIADRQRTKSSGNNPECADMFAARNASIATAHVPTRLRQTKAVFSKSSFIRSLIEIVALRYKV